jgi:hypothetical protein
VPGLWITSTVTQHDRRARIPLLNKVATRTEPRFAETMTFGMAAGQHLWSAGSAEEAVVSQQSSRPAEWHDEH